MAATISTGDGANLDNTIQIVPATESVPEHFVADNTRVRSEFYGDKVVFKSRGYYFTWTPQEMKYADEFGTQDSVYSVQDVPIEVKANYVRYNRSMPDIDDWFIQENDRLKHQILVQGFQRDPMPWLMGDIDFVIGGSIEFDASLRVKADGAEVSGPFETDEHIEIIDANGDYVFNLPKIVAYDSKIPERAMTYGKYRVTSNEGGVLAFDIVVSNAWITDLDRVYPLVIDPTVIVSSGYHPRGIVRLTSGNIYAAVRNGTTDFRIYKSIDGGSTWSLFVTVSESTWWVSLITDGTYIFALNTYDGGAGNVDGVKFRKYNESGTLQISATVDSGQSATGECSIALAGNGDIHAAWSSSNASYPSVYNIRYSKSTDGGSTWSTPSQRTTNADSNYEYPNVLVTSSNNPIIIYRQQAQTGVTQAYIKCLIYNGSTWTTSTVKASTNSGYLQYSVDAIIDGNGVIHAVWEESMPVTFSPTRVLYSKSTDGGNTWSTYTDLTPTSNGATSPRISKSSTNNLYVFFSSSTYNTSGTYENIVKTVFDGTSWSAPVNLTNSTTNYQNNPRAMTAESGAMIGYMWLDQGVSVQFDKISFNTVPDAPTALSRTNFDATAAAVFTWSFSDPNSGNTQSAYQMLIKRVSDGVTVVDTGKVASTSPSRTVSGGTLSNNVQYQWQVKTWDNLDAEGPYSSLATFFTSAKPSATITVPATDGATVGTTSLTAEWTFSDPESEGQSAYQIKLTDSSDSVLWDSGKVTDVSGRSRTISYTLVNSTSYKVKLTVWDFRDVISTEVVRTFSTSFVVPATPTIVATAQTGYIGLTVTNPAPSGGQPTVNSNDIYRRKSGETAWVRIAAGVIANGSYNDYAVASGITYEYKVTAVGDNGTTADSATDSESITLSGIWLHDVADPAGTAYNFKLDGQGRESEWKPDVTIMQFAGRTLPVAEFGESEEGKLSASLQLLKNTLDFTKLDALVRRKATICWRDSYGRKAFGIIPALPITDEHWGYSTSIELTEIAYSEVV